MTAVHWFFASHDAGDTSARWTSAAKLGVQTGTAHTTLADPDAALLAQLRTGDETALGTLFDAHTLALVRFLEAMLGSRDAARDVVQDVFWQLWSRRETLDVRTTLRAYLFAAARGHALHVLRGAHREHDRYDALTRDDPAAVTGLPVARPDQDAEDAELAAAIEGAMTQLTPRVRAVAELRWYGQMSYAEIAGILGVSERTVNNQLTTAVKVLRPLLATFRTETPPPTR